MSARKDGRRHDEGTPRDRGASALRRTAASAAGEGEGEGEGGERRHRLRRIRPSRNNSCRNTALRRGARLTQFPINVSRTVLSEVTRATMARLTSPSATCAGTVEGQREEGRAVVSSGIVGVDECVDLVSHLVAWFLPRRIRRPCLREEIRAVRLREVRGRFWFDGPSLEGRGCGPWRCRCGSSCLLWGHRLPDGIGQVLLRRRRF